MSENSGFKKTVPSFRNGEFDDERDYSLPLVKYQGAEVVQEDEDEICLAVPESKGNSSVHWLRKDDYDVEVDPATGLVRRVKEKANET